MFEIAADADLLVETDADAEVLVETDADADLVETDADTDVLVETDADLLPLPYTSRCLQTFIPSPVLSAV